MNQSNPKNINSRLPEIGAIVLVLAAIGYYFYSGGSAPAASSSFTISSATTSVGTDVVNLLNQIKSLRIDTSLFQAPVYESLTDFSVMVPPESIGKSNPFIPLGGSSASVPASTPASLPPATN
jgi:hypothetical protein